MTTQSKELTPEEMQKRIEELEARVKSLDSAYGTLVRRLNFLRDEREIVNINKRLDALEGHQTING